MLSATGLNEVAAGLKVTGCEAQGDMAARLTIGGLPRAENTNFQNPGRIDGSCYVCLLHKSVNE